MNIFRHLALLMAIGMVLPACAAPVKATQDEPPNGTLHMYYKFNNTWPEDCNFPVSNRNVAYQHQDFGCHSDEDYGFKIDNVPSATLITFYDDGLCRDEEGDWVFTVKTIQQPTRMTEPLELEASFNRPVGTVLAPGVILYSKTRHHGGGVNGKLTCVKMQLSPKP